MSFGLDNFEIDSDVEHSEGTDFDPSALLQDPLFDDSEEFGLLRQPMQQTPRQQQNVFKPKPASFQVNGSSQQNIQLPFQEQSSIPQQSSFPQQQPQQPFMQQQPQQQQQFIQQQNFSNNMNIPQNQVNQNQPTTFAPLNDSVASLNDSDAQIQGTQQAVTMRMQELQSQIQQVQQQIQQVQLQSNQLELQQVDNPNGMHQQGMMQGMVNNNAGMAHTTTPDRNFMPQQQMPQQQQRPQQGPSLAAMAASLQQNQLGMNDSSSNNSFNQGVQTTQGEKAPSNVNEAMEKLCESMRRSAMSRSLVKQLSGRSAPGSRGVSRSRSGGGLTRGNLSRNASGTRSIQRSYSGSDPLRQGPIRRPTHDTKHRIQRDALSSSGGPPGRGVFRNKSSQGALGGTTRLQIDDSTVGMF